MIGKDKIDGLGTVTISFRKMAQRIGGSAIYSRTKDFKIAICKYQSMTEVKRILAHECCHVKQYFLKELIHRREVKSVENSYGRLRLACKNVAVWKGKEILRCAYSKRGWEVEARKMEKLATKRIPKTLKPKTQTIKKVPVTSVAPNTFEQKVLNILSIGKITNSEFVSTLIKDKIGQAKIDVLKAIYKLKEMNLIKQVIVDSVVYIEVASFGSLYELANG